ncbi:MAG: hypothetical protein ACRDRG_00135 [Pseudonocardiaceae bacterium]
MLKDPQAGEDSGSPYDILAEAGVGPSSSMQDIRDASYHFMEQDRWGSEVRGAWDELRTLERRLAVDFLLYDIDIGVEASSARRAVLAELRQQRRTNPAELCDLDGEFHEITLDSLAAPGIAAFDQPPPLPGPDIVEFDR